MIPQADEQIIPMVHQGGWEGRSHEPVGSDSFKEHGKPWITAQLCMYHISKLNVAVMGSAIFILGASESGMINLLSMTELNWFNLYSFSKAQESYPGKAI